MIPLEFQKLSNNYLVALSLIAVIILGLLSYAENADAKGAYFCSTTCKKLEEAKKKAEQQKTINKTTVDGKSVTVGTVSKVQIIKDIGAKNFISLRMSNACKRLDSSQCPNMKELADKFDNSNKYLSGDFYFDNKTQVWKRSSPKIPNVFELYKFIDRTPWVLWVDPDDYTWDRSKQIIIEPSLHYIDRSDEQIDDKRMRYEYEGLYLKQCISAVIGWENNGSAILLDVLNHFYSNCREQVKYDPTISIFMGTKIFADCDKACLYYKENFKMQLKAEALSQKIPDKVIKSADRTCYGIYCKDEKPTTEQTVKSLEEKEKIRIEHLKELEAIQKCERLKREDKQAGRTDIENIDCKNTDQRNKYLVGR